MKIVNMKKTLLLGLIFLSALNMFSQVNFSETDNKWYVINTYPNGNSQNPNFMETTTTIYGNVGDSIFNTETWAKIGFTTDSSVALSNYTYVGLTKSSQNYVQFIENGSSSIDTLYNFNVNIGDSVFYSFDQGFSPTYLHVDSIDSVLIGGLYHKKIFFEKVFAPLCCAIEEVWIDGIGSLHGPLFPFSPIMLEIESYLEPLDVTCFEQNGNLTWSNPDYSNCYTNIVLDVDEEENDSKIRLYPNPSTNFLIIENLNSKKGDLILEIRSLTGKLELVQKIGNVAKKKIRIHSIPSGIYFISIKDSQNFITSKKWIKTE